MTTLESRIDRSSTWFCIPLNSEKNLLFFTPLKCAMERCIFLLMWRLYLYMTAPQCMTRPDVKPDATMRSNSLASVRAAPVHVRIRRITTEKNLFIRSPIDCDEDKKESKVLLKVFLDMHLGFAIIIRTRFSGALFCSLLWGFPLFRQLWKGKSASLM